MSKKKWRKYIVNDKIQGRGVYGSVFFGFDPKKNRKVAIKTAVGGNIKVAKNEAKVMQGYGTHRLLPKIYDFFIENETSYIVMELIKGKILGECKFKKPPIIQGEKAAVQITLQVLEVLNHLHSKGYVHNDIYPHNIMLESLKPITIKVIDFGLSAKFTSDTARNKDIYHAARLCVYLMYGTEDDSINKLTEQGGKISEILLKALSSNVGERYQNAADFYRALLSLKYK